MTRRFSVQMLTALTTLIQALGKKEEMGFGIHSKEVWRFIDHTHMVDRSSKQQYKEGKAGLKSAILDFTD